MELIGKLKQKLLNILEQINTGCLCMSNDDITHLLSVLVKLTNKRVYRADIADKFNVDIDDGIDMLIIQGKIPVPYHDDDGVEYWMSNDLMF